MPQNEVKIVITTDANGAVVGIKKTEDAYTTSLKNVETTSSSALSRIKSHWLGIAAAVGTVMVAYNKLIQPTFDYLATIETAQMGIASAFLTSGKFIDQTTGKVLQGMDAFRAAQGMAADTIRDLQAENLQTIATLDQLVRAYQETLPVAMRVGFDTKQVKEFTTAVVQAAGAIGLSLDMLAEETRSMLTGVITPRTSRIAVVLGLTNEDIRQNSANADQLFNFLMGKLDAYRIAGIETQKTWDGLWSNVKDISQQIAGQAFEPLFEAIKKEVYDITQDIITIDETTKQIKWNPDFLQTIEDVQDVIKHVLIGTYELGMALDSVGGFLTRIAGTLTAIGAALTWGDWDKAFREMNKNLEQFHKDLEANYKRSQQAVINLKVNKAVSVGSGGIGFNQNEIKQVSEEAEKAAKAAAKLRDEYDAMMLHLNRDIEMVGLDDMEKQLLLASNTFTDLKRELGEAKAQKWFDLQIKLIDAQEFEKTLDAVKGAFKNLEEAFIPSLEDREKARKEMEELLQGILQDEGKYHEMMFDVTATDLEKRLAEWDDFYGDIIELLDRLDLADEEYNERSLKAFEIAQQRKKEIIEESMPKTFEQGVDEGMDEYLKTLEWGFDRGKELSREAFTSMENFFEDLFVGKVKLSWESLLGWMGGLFAKFMAQVTTQMLAQSGNITGMLGGMGNILPGLGGTLGSIGIGGAIGMIGGNLFGGGTGANIGGIAGGIGGSLLNSAFAGSMFFSGGLLGSQLGTYIMPVIGTLLGAAIGFAVDALLGDDTIQQKFRVVGGEVHTYGDMSSKKEKELLETLQPLYDSFVDMAEKIGLEAADLFDIGRWGLEDQGKISSKELMNSFYRGLLDALGLDTEIFKPYQKEGEKYYETIVRVMSALSEGIPAAMDAIDDYIGAIESSSDAIAQARRQLRGYDDQIAEIQDAFDAASDPTDQQQYALEVTQLLYEKYAYEKALILGIVASIRSLEAELANWTISLQQKIDGLTGSFDSIGMMWDRMSAIAGQLADTSLSAADRLQLLQEGVGWLDQWVAANIAAIQQQYEMQKEAIQQQIDAVNQQIDALRQQKEAINEQISGLQEQLSLSRQWKSLLDSVKQSIRDMKTTYSQRDDLEQLDYLRSEIDALFGKYQGATGEEKIGYANELQNIIKQYLQLAGDTLQLPSLEYGKVYEDMLKILETIQSDATEGSATEQDILAQIETLQQEANDIDEQIRQKQDEIAALNQQMLDLDKAMQADIQAFKESAVIYYEWAQTEGAKLIEEQKQMLEDQLGELVGDLGVDGYLALKQQETVDRLTDIQALLQSILDAFGNIPQSAEGAYFTRPSLTWIAERGPEWVIRDEDLQMRGNAGTKVTIAPVITVQVAEATDMGTVRQVGRVIGEQVIETMRSPRGRMEIQRIAKGR